MEAAFCKSKVHADDLTSIQYYRRCRLNTLSVPTVCIECKVVAVTWIEDYCTGLQADVSALRDKVRRTHGGRSGVVGRRLVLRRHGRTGITTP